MGKKAFPTSSSRLYTQTDNLIAKCIKRLQLKARSQPLILIRPGLDEYHPMSNKRLEPFFALYQKPVDMEQTQLYNS